MDRRFFKARLPEKLLNFGIKEQLTFLKGCRQQTNSTRIG